MPKKHYQIQLTDEERSSLTSLLKKGTMAARKLARAQILRQADAGKQDGEMAESVGVGLFTVERTGNKYGEGGLAHALTEAPRPGGKPKLDEKQEAYLLALTCRTSPADRVCSTMQLGADRLVEVGIVEDIADETVRHTLKKTCSSPGKSSRAASPVEAFPSEEARRIWRQLEFHNTCYPWQLVESRICPRLFQAGQPEQKES